MWHTLTRGNSKDQTKKLMGAAQLIPEYLSVGISLQNTFLLGVKRLVAKEPEARTDEHMLVE